MNGSSALREIYIRRGLRRHPEIYARTMCRLPWKGGRLKMALKVADNEELVGWVLSFGSDARVIAPESLHEKVREQAKAILKQV